MRYSVLGRSGPRVSEVCLGTTTFGTENGRGADWAESQAIFDAVADAGGNFLDTAGSSERWVGKLVASERGRFVIGTTLTMSRPASPTAWTSGAAGTPWRLASRAPAG